jgi:hypothetical protein
MGYDVDGWILRAVVVECDSGDFVPSVVEMMGGDMCIIFE